MNAGFKLYWIYINKRNLDHVFEKEQKLIAKIDFSIDLMHEKTRIG